jgi:hypothetical protein
VGTTIVAFLAILSFTVLYQAPSCSDSVQNQSEAGIDCGGPCAYLCTAQVRPPTVLFTKALSRGDGRTDVIASVENVNMTAAAKNVPYTIALYGADQVLVQEVKGTVDLPPASTVPIFVSGITSGSQNAIRAFLTIDSSAPKWFTLASDTRIVPVVVNAALSGSIALPRIDAVLMNSSVIPLSDVSVVILVHNDQGDVLAASRTVVPTIPAQGQATATFTWNSAFASLPARIEGIPIIPLP